MGRFLRAAILCNSFVQLTFGYSPINSRQSGSSYPNVTYPGQKGDDYDYTGFEPDQAKRADAVIEMFRFAWNGYYSIVRNVAV